MQNAVSALPAVFSRALPAAGTHLELLVEFAAVAIQHGQIERAKVCIEAGHSGKTH